ncbi:unannotated protein [freshwater metagenome]|uniref:Unannotated protein n=1 Tax=freshwater metagenome TaxID=449393 RepID=A0A6J7AAL9_9ZZZZ
MVIDLPDGQKLVIGKMGQGTVIEVATWRGVGRPDSRTSRMMFGMSSAEIDVDNPDSEVNKSPEIAGSILSQILGYPMALIRWLFNIQHVPKPKRNKDGSKKLLVQSNETQAKSVITEISSTARKIIQRLVQKAGPVVAKSYSVSKDKIMMVLKKKSPVKSASQELTSTDLDVEKWLESLTSSTNKKSISSGNTTSNTDKKKK